MKRWLKRIGLSLAGLAFIAGLLLVDFVRSFQRSVPSYDGTLNVTAVAAPVQILRDRYAIPHIFAASLPDAAFGLGYVHAQDRLWQMETSRRFIQGRLAELFGASAVGTDTMMRAMDLYGAAQEAVKHLSPESRLVLQAYADGVNTYLKGHKGPLGIEFALAGDTPEPWVPADSIAVLKGMAMQLSGNAFSEAARASLIPVLGRMGVQDFFLPFGDAPLPAYLDTLYGTTQTGQAYGIPDITASDNWAVDGAHSVTGKPLLANDPHLGFSIPSVWYLA
ncbi:MAG TPA: penicillin acylase family protein, partial [Micropepsaceae bacterium]